MNAQPKQGMIFTGPSVLAIIDGSKTQERRLVKPQPHPGNYRWMDDKDYPEVYGAGGVWLKLKIPHQPGDVLYVKEAWRETEDIDGRRVIAYRAGGTRLIAAGPSVTHGEHRILSVLPRWRSPLFMPAWAARTSLVVTVVRCQRVAEISEADVWAEGIDRDKYEDWLEEAQSVAPGGSSFETPKDWFGKRWDSLHEKPKPVRRGGTIDHYESYPFSGKPETRHKNYRGWIIRPNPFVFAYTFERTEAL